MISVNEAKNTIHLNTTRLPPVTVDLKDASGKVLGETLYASVNSPGFPQAAMDGYAFAYRDLNEEGLTVIATLQAGSGGGLVLQQGQASRIFTGAAVPKGADTVVAQEKTIRSANRLRIEDLQLKPGANIRLLGAEIQSGQPVLEKGVLLTPAATGFLATAGCHKIPVYPDPAVIIIATGKELCPPGQPLKPGQVYESNSYALTAALLAAGIRSVVVRFADDTLDEVTALLRAALAAGDLVLLTGGVSVGDFDFVLRAAESCNVITLFHKVKQRPGKPLFFGKKEERLVFGLPGNPAAALTCFYEYVLPAIAGQTGRPLSLNSIRVPATERICKSHPFTQFLKGYYNGHTVLSLEAQESYRMRSFATANCLIVLGADQYECEKGEPVEIHLLPS
ncbi:gephyrin-like molybdotransferase Glp [Niabella beijingensis]|uniref:molybdopterin molybdotransferase MoeA n=1 Tax=Niabella beijingensis TaxID=2872700 RepID=UPI001CBE6AB5|nr:gephyrin-like molybdotransferase Glp [Niabella beijingensis]MBZ4191340.1 molybdopterin molybdotransferase MoeA [Niabella beijingensis]